MAEIAWGFPITGNKVSEVLMGNFIAEDMWRLSFLDVPSGTESPETLNELRDRMDSGPVEMSTGDLCEALAGAPQVWVLDMRLVSDTNVQLYIEDGEVFELNLERT